MYKVLFIEKIRDAQFLSAKGTTSFDLFFTIFSAIYRLNVGNIVILWIHSLINRRRKKATILDGSQGVLL